MIFGGSFDPVHNGHLMLIEQAFLNIPVLDLLIIFPTGDHPESKKYLFNNEQRLIMLKSSLGLLTKGDKKFLANCGVDSSLLLSKYKGNKTLVSVSDFEIKNNNKSYTINTIEHVESKFPKANIHLLIGADQAADFSQWYRVQEIAQKVSLWTFPRENYSYDPLFLWNIMEFSKIGVSSSLIRKLLLSNKSLENEQVPKSVQILAPLFLNKNNH